MPVPTTYSEAEIKTLMVTTLGTVAAALSWTTATPAIQESVYDAAILLGVSDVADATDIAKLRAAARLAVWRAAVGALAGMTTFSSAGSSYNLSDLQRQAKESLAVAEREAAVHGVDPAMAARVDHIRWRHDPYATLNDELRTIP